MVDKQDGIQEAPAFSGVQKGLMVHGAVTGAIISIQRAGGGAAAKSMAFDALQSALVEFGLTQLELGEINGILNNTVEELHYIKLNEEQRDYWKGISDEDRASLMTLISAMTASLDSKTKFKK
ncbi:hypothetical protein EJD96_16000 [Herbaspirillum seropedicae]|uniref:hypothetical protein n=1 Tax=Herbaspirillum seropedicae TaxID=964 RepID=UPI00111E4C0E|nr:hypothetical protein [Herbaspirillum seropedicae]QDD65551.1 hypothetical protein EJD96_16000 [Herbaspirillum seropedicae]